MKGQRIYELVADVVLFGTPAAGSQDLGTPGAALSAPSLTRSPVGSYH